MADPFAAPSTVPSADYFKPQDHVGGLILFKPTGQDLAYTFGGKAKKPAETTITDVVVIDEEDTSKSVEYTGAHVSPYGIRKVLIPKINEGLILARLGKQPDPSKTESGAYYLDDPSEDDVELARAYLASKQPTL